MPLGLKSSTLPLSHCAPTGTNRMGEQAKAQTSLRICAASSEPLFLTYTKGGQFALKNAREDHGTVAQRGGRSTSFDCMDVMKGSDRS